MVTAGLTQLDADRLAVSEGGPSTEAISAVGKQYQDTAALISAISTEASGTSLRCLDGTARWHTEASAMAADTTEELEELGEK